tara:strand:+ start:120 stop:1196 length:1077 start_codon:yes stop_codon:yes gene_type:complete
MQTLGKQEVSKSIGQKYNCIFCDYNTCVKSNYDKHLTTAKHKMREIEGLCPHKCSCGKVFTRIDNLNRHKRGCGYEKNPKAKVSKSIKSLPKVCHGFECICGKTYKHACSLSKHKKTCLHCSSSTVMSNNSSEVLDVLGTLNAKLDKTCEDNQMLNAKLDETTAKLDKSCEDNRMLKEKLNQLESGVMTAVSEPKTVNNYNNNIIFLLNEKCGDAVAIKDFANQIAMCLEDVDYAMENGKVKGIENIIRKKFEELGTFKRPLHCTDVKRGTLYVKNEEGWEKEKGEINKMIRDIECVQTSGITVWTDANPEYSEGNMRMMDKWLRIVQCLTGSIEGLGMRKIEKRCQEMCKIDQNVIV